MSNSKPKSKRRNMRRFALEEISVVDKPAQEGAKMALMKRKDEPLSKRLIKHYLDNGSFAEDVMASITKSAGAEKAVAVWPGVSAVATSLQSITKDHSLSDVQKVEMMKSSVEDFVTFTKERLPDVESHLLKAVSTEDNGMNLRQLQKNMIALSTKLDGVIARMEKAAEGGGEGDSTRLRSALAKDGTEKAGDTMMPFMEDTEKAEDELPPFMETEKAEEDEYEYPVDEETEKAVDEPEPEKPTSEGEEDEPIGGGSPTPIGGKRASKRQAGNDAVLQIGKRLIRKSAIGDDLFAVLKSQQETVDLLAKQAQDERDLREVVEFSKVAEDELAHLPGKVEEKALLLKRLSDVLNDGERVVLSRMLKAGNAGISTAFSTIGHKAQKAAAAGNFSKRVNEIRSREGCSHVDAMRKARREFPDEFANYQDSN